MRFRKKPVVVEAIKFDGQNQERLYDWSNGEIESKIMWLQGKTYHQVTIETLEGEMVGSKGDWIIKGIKGEFYPCKPDIFEATYEAV